MNIEGPNRTESQHFFLSEGSCTRILTGRFRGANHFHRRTDHTYLPDFQGVILTDDGASVYFDYQGYGRAPLWGVGRSSARCSISAMTRATIGSTMRSVWALGKCALCLRASLIP